MERVMLAIGIQPEKVKFPVIASPKIDGVRCHIEKGSDRAWVMSRTNKPIPNQFVQSVLGKMKYIGLDGELIVGDICSPSVFRDTTSGVMTVSGEPKVTYNVFDFCPDDYSHRYPFTERLSQLKTLLEKNPSDYIRIVPQERINNIDELLKFEQKCLNEGYEGIVIRKPDSPYKEGRSTLKEGYMLKIKRFTDDEARVVGFEELLRNENAAFKDEMGYTARSYSKEGLVGAKTLGALIVETDLGKFRIGSGFDEKTRQEIWDNQEKYIGKLVTFKYFQSGMKELPRFPIFKSFRSEIDV